MKNLKQFILLAFIGIFVIAVTFVACDNGNISTQDGSEAPKTHTGAEVAGMKAGMVINKEIGVTTDEMTAILGHLRTIYSTLSDDVKINFEALITKINVHPGTDVTKDGDILKIGKAEGETAIKSCMSAIPAEERNYTYDGTGTYPTDFTNGFDIVKMTNASQAKADTIIKHLIGAYNHEDWEIIDPLKKQNFLDNISKVILNNGTAITYDPLDLNSILYIGVNFNLNAHTVDGYSDLEQYLVYEVIYLIVNDNNVYVSKTKNNNHIKLANIFGNSKVVTHDSSYQFS